MADQMHYQANTDVSWKQGSSSQALQRNSSADEIAKLLHSKNQKRKMLAEFKRQFEKSEEVMQSVMRRLTEKANEVQQLNRELSQQRTANHLLQKRLADDA